MENDAITQPSPSPKKQKNILAIILSILLVIAVGAIAYGVYAYVISPQSSDDTKSTDQTKTDQVAKTASAPHSVLSEGYPFGTELKVTTKLGVSASLQSIVKSSSIQDPGYNDVLTNKFNDEMGRWQFGKPTINNPDGAGEIHLLHIADDWLAQNNKTGNDSSYAGSEYPIKLPEAALTVATKKTLIDTLASDTKACAENKDKGFVISGFLNVCATPNLITQSQGSYSPVVYYKGYGVSNGRSFVLLGWLRLHESSEFTDTEADKLASEFKKGDIPQITRDAIADYNAALQSTMITVSKR